MKCPYCGKDNTRVIDSRPADDGDSIRRRRECDECHKRFTTYEKVETIPMIVIKKEDVYKRQPHTYVVGNIGMPYADVADGMEPDAMTAVEISSFMLESIVEFHPKVSAILNITPDHLNRHHTMDNYIAAKERIAENQTKADTCVLNYDDEVLRAYGENCPADVLFFSRLHKLEQGVDLEDGYLVLKRCV